MSWRTILHKRARYREVFSEFDPMKVARYGKRKIESLLRDPGIVRNRLKVESAVRNARAFLEIQKEFGSFDAYVWAFVDGTPTVNRFEALSDLPAQTDLSKRISKDLKRRGFRFVGPTTVYAFMQAAGLVNDHVVSCDRRRALA